MTEMVMPQIETAASENHVRSRAIKRFASGDNFFRRLTQGAAIAVLLILGGVILSLIKGSIPAFQTFGLSFLTTVVWNPVTEKFGAEYDVRNDRYVRHRHGDRSAGRPWDRHFSHRAMPALLAPSDWYRDRVIGGRYKHNLWNLGPVRVRPFLQQYVQPGVIALFANVPVMSSLFAGPPYGIGMLTASLILAIMVLPFIASISRDVFQTVPPILKNRPTGSAARHGRSSAIS